MFNDLWHIEVMVPISVVIATFGLLFPDSPATAVITLLAVLYLSRR